MLINKKIGVIGAGHLGTSLIKGLLESGFPSENLFATCLDHQHLETLSKQYAIQVSNNNLEVAKKVDILLVSVKPNEMANVMVELNDQIHQNQTFVISTGAGVPMKALKAWLSDECSIVRVMPNMPASLGLAVTGLYASDSVTNEQKKLADDIMKAVGKTVWVDNDDQMNIVTALSGSGPAYFFLVMEALRDAAVKLGLDENTAQTLTLQTALGASQLAITSSEDVSVLRKQVTSPGGTTEAALNFFESKEIRQVISGALEAATTRAEEISESVCV